jgi:transcriptional/translational regulatory protein YebC/TACO1
MIEKFEEDEDISAVYHNLEITPELAQHLEQL